MKKRKRHKKRNGIVVAMLLTCKGGFFHDKRLKRGGAKNKQAEYQNEDY